MATQAIDAGDRLLKLEQRHLQLLEELDSLNVRLEQALSPFSKPADEPAAESLALADAEASCAGRDCRTC
jgi:hypothetical protein